MSDRLPELVRYPDGHEEPFEAERITRQLFIAGETLGATDSFFARELTDGILHFLAPECDGAPATPELIAELIGKVLRQFGHLALARAYEERTQNTPPPVPVRQTTNTTWPAWFSSNTPPLELWHRAATETLSNLSVQSIYPRELVSAHQEGLLHLTDLATPFELAALVLPHTTEPVEAIRRARHLAGQVLALDSPEYLLAETGQGVPEFLTALAQVATECNVRLELHLNCAEPPPHASNNASGPLFGTATAVDLERLQTVRQALLNAELGSRLTLAWHVASANSDNVLHELAAQQTLAGSSIEFVVDRPKRPTILGVGLTRKTEAVLSLVGMNLLHLVEQMGGGSIARALFLKKVGSLARFAKTAGHVRQDFLRKHGRPGLREGFLLERAKLFVLPTGLEDAALALHETPTETARLIVAASRQALETDRPRMLPLGLDVQINMAKLGLSEGLSSPKQQLRTAALLHAESGGGCALISNPPGREWTVGEAVEVLRSAVTSEVQRFRLVKSC